MDKSFWLQIRQNEFAFPEGHDLPALTEELLGYLGSVDPELRDTIAYETFATWLAHGLYSPDQLRAYALRLQLNLQEGLGEPESDGLFLRSFSVLCLAEIVNNDGQYPFLDADEVRNILSKGLAYLEAEADPRGYVPEKGWGHALAHTADLLFVLARSHHLHADDLARILNAIAAKLVNSTNWIYVHGEDDRLARAALTVFERDLLDAATLEAWLRALTSPGEEGWKEAWADEGRAAAFFNTRNFLRSVALRVINADSVPHREQLQSLLLEANASLRSS
ncbi:MAG: DUF2785 domain-containing protein [Bacteroidota bacterium]